MQMIADGIVVTGDATRETAERAQVRSRHRRRQQLVKYRETEKFDPHRTGLL